ncbi:pantoate--beta-alanine ligase [Dolichospermum sp. ST_sed1]|nr:pantoate--beta-alanine ligase [Dolichospermum sp. ST_sed1]
MKIKTLIAIEDAVAKVREWKKDQKRIALVPTMGALHEGHLALVQSAKSAADIVIVTIFVNPTQFGPTEDFAKYPRTLKDDMQMLEALNVDYVFTPNANDLYSGDFQTWVYNDMMANQLCGLTRNSHFKGVCTVVLKLFNIFRPDIAFFGKKDYQQLSVLKAMVQDLNVDMEIQGINTIRHPDGLAMSSRNRYLSDVDRKLALQISKGLNAVQETFNKGEKNIKILSERFFGCIGEHSQVQIEYCEFRKQNRLTEFQEVINAPAVLLVAVRVSNVRLIDNIELGTYEFI